MVDDYTGIRIAKEIGFDAYDLFPGRELVVKDAKFFRETFAKTSMLPSALTLVGSALTDFNIPVRKSTLEWINGQMQIAGDIGCEMIVLALGGYEWEGKEIKPELQWGWAVENVRELGDRAKDNGMKVAIEMNPYQLYIVHSLDTVLKFVREVDNPSVGVNADVSHMHLSKDPPERLKELGSRIIHVHLSDNNGIVHGDLPPGRGTAPLRDYLRVLKEMGFDGTATIELEFSPDPERIREWVKESYDVTAGMMKELGVR